MTPGAGRRRFYVRNDGRRRWCRCRRCSRCSATFGPQFTNRFNVYRASADHRIVGARLQLRPGDGGPRGRCPRDARPDVQLRLGRPVVPGASSAAGTSGITYGLSLVFVFLILAALYESWSLPFSVLLTVPIAVFGAFARPAAAQVRSRRLRTDRRRHADRPGGQERDPDRRVRKVRLEAGQPLVEAALEGARLRLRPILMTSFAFILGCVPLWAATGSGAAARRILGTVVITGMLAATLIAVFLDSSAVRALRTAGAQGQRPQRHDDRAGAGGERVMSIPTIDFVARWLALAALAAAPACTAGPNYKRPPVVAPDEFRGGRDPLLTPRRSATSRGRPSSTTRSCGS